MINLKKLWTVRDGKVVPVKIEKPKGDLKPLSRAARKAGRDMRKLLS